MTARTDADESSAARRRVGRRRHASTPGALLCAITVGALPALTTAGETQGDARQWLEKMTRAAQTLNYDGTFVYRKGDSMESMRIIHRYDDEGERERLVAQSGAAREVVRDNRSVTCILPDDEAVVVAKRRAQKLAPGKILDGEEELSRHYDLRVHEGERVAGRSTKLVVVEAMDEFRYDYRLFVDEQTGLLLKSELVGPDGEPREQIVYTNITMPDTIPDELLEPETSGEGYTWYRNEAAAGPETETTEGESSAWKPGWLPPGFELHDRARDPILSSRDPVEHLVYSDGLASVSLFIERLEDAKDRLNGRSAMGAVNAFGRMVGEHQITVVGEVPAATVERIGRSIRQR